MPAKLEKGDVVTIPAVYAVNPEKRVNTIHLSYPDLSTEEGAAEGCKLTRMTAEEREMVASVEFRGMLDEPRIVALNIPPGVDRERCTHYCNGAVRYIEAYSVNFDLRLGRLDLAYEEDATEEA